MRESFWQNNSLVAHIIFELQPIIIFSPGANFGDQSLITGINSNVHIILFMVAQAMNRLFFVVKQPVIVHFF